MSLPTLRCYDYVNRPYAIVRAALLENATQVFEHATVAAARHAATLHVALGPLDVGADVAITIVGVEQDTAYDAPATKLRLAWSAVEHPGLFPAMEATLSVFALSPTETQLELAGRYAPPMGVLGKALDAALGHKIAEASVNRFVQEVAGWLRNALPVPIAAPSASA